MLLVISFLLPIASSDTTTLLVPVTIWIAMGGSTGAELEVQFDFTAIVTIRHNLVDVPAESLDEAAAA